jgi:hypothetical protein
MYIFAPVSRHMHRASGNIRVRVGSQSRAQNHVVKPIRSIVSLLSRLSNCWERYVAYSVLTNVPNIHVKCALAVTLSSIIAKSQHRLKS